MVMARSSRRRFLFAVGGGAPLILGAADKAGSRRPILGEGEHTYEVYHDWGELPAEIKYGNTHGVCEDSQGRIYVHHTVNAVSESSDTMVVFDADGKFIKSWGKEFKGGAHGLHINKEGNQEFLYLCDTKRALVVKTTLAGEEVFTLGYPEQAQPYKPGADGKRIKYSPTNLAIAPNADIYVGDGYGSSYVNVYNSKGEYRFTFGGPGKEAGQLSCPHGIICDRRGATPVITVADRSNNRIQNFTLEGKHIEFIGGTNLPCHFSFYKNGDVVVPDLGARVTLLDRNNKVITHLGDDSAANTWKDVRKEPRDKFTPGKFVCPHGACFDHAGNIFVVEWVEVGRVSKLRRVA
jgi:DNA-binding beta-propeller fold protein YncE